MLCQPLLGSLLGFLGGLVSQVVHTGSVVVLLLQVLHLLAHQQQADHVQDDDNSHEAVGDHVHGGHVGERAGDADEQGIHKHPDLGELTAEKDLSLDLAEEAGGNDRGEHEHEHFVVDLEDDNGNVISCPIVDAFEFEENEYVLAQNPEDESVYLFRSTEEGELIVPEEAEFDKVTEYYTNVLAED